MLPLAQAFRVEKQAGRRPRSEDGFGCPLLAVLTFQHKLVASRGRDLERISAGCIGLVLQLRERHRRRTGLAARFKLPNERV